MELLLLLDRNQLGPAWCLVSVHPGCPTGEVLQDGHWAGGPGTP